MQLPTAIRTWSFTLLLPALCVAAADDLPPPHRLVQQSANEVLAISGDIDSVDAITDEHVRRLQEQLRPVVAFDRIARAVIGDNADAVGAQELDRFTRTFKETMTRFYLETLVSFEVTDASVVPPEDAIAADASRATVRVQARDAAGNRYTLDYSLSRDESGSWRVHNMILDGVNLGLSYRSQFDSALDTYNGSLDRVIANWRDFVEQ